MPYSAHLPVAIEDLSLRDIWVHSTQRTHQLSREGCTDVEQFSIAAGAAPTCMASLGSSLRCRSFYSHAGLQEQLARLDMQKQHNR